MGSTLAWSISQPRSGRLGDVSAARPGSIGSATCRGSSRMLFNAPAKVVPCGTCANRMVVGASRRGSSDDRATIWRLMPSSRGRELQPRMNDEELRMRCKADETAALRREAAELLSRSRWWQEELLREELLRRDWYRPAVGPRSS
jgi:hypothetical protein